MGHEEDEEVQQLIIELLSNITTPRVSEILATSALLKWGPPLKDPTDPKFENTLDHITEDSDFSYEVRFLLTDIVYVLVLSFHLFLKKVESNKKHLRLF